jgi:MOSC domain-containing protein YiiM
MGENITPRGIDLMALPRGTSLNFGKSAAVHGTDVREPCGTRLDASTSIVRNHMYS